METGYYWVEIHPIYEEESSTIAYYEKSTNNWYLHNIEGDQTMSIYKVIKSIFDSENESYKKGWDDATSQAINSIKNKTDMSNFKGTKGKWIVDNNGYYFDIKILQTDEKVINASVFCNVSENGSVYQSCIIDNETEANALLISKAPEMLEMLERVKNDLPSDQGWAISLESEIEKLIKEATEI